MARREAIVGGLGLTLVITAVGGWYLFEKRRRRKRCREQACAQTRLTDIRLGFPGLVGNTPMVELRKLSRATGCTILAKAEFLNPGGSTKDRVAKSIIDHAAESGTLRPGGTVVEGTSGSTGISLAFMAKARGYACEIVMPDDMAEEKSRVLRQVGATVREVRPASIVNKQHYCNVAAARAKELGGEPHALFADQFETSANFDAHYRHTGPEIWAQTNGSVDAFVMSAGTGGTIAGVSTYLKERKPAVRVFLADPPGSSLYHAVRHGVCYAPEQAERRVRRHRYDTIAEGIGLDRQTANFRRARIDHAFRVNDRSAVEMAHYVLREEGLFLGSSSAVNLVATMRAARAMGPGHTIVTVLCDSGQRHLTKFWNPKFLAKWGLTPRAKGLEFLDPKQ